MPLTFASIGESTQIQKINGKDDVRRFLENLGFVVGSQITVVSRNSGNLIVHVKESRIAISQSMANRIMVGGGVK